MARAKGASLSFMAALYLCVIQEAGGATFDIQNNCTFTVWAAASPSGGQRLVSGQSWTLQVPAGTNMGRFWGRTGCSFNSSGRGSCNTGDCGGLLNCQGYGSLPVSYASDNASSTFICPSGTDYKVVFCGSAATASPGQVSNLLCDCLTMSVDFRTFSKYCAIFP